MTSCSQINILLFIVILFLSYKFFMQNKTTQTGGDNHMNKLLEEMVANGDFTDEQKLNQLNEKKKNNEDIVKKKNNIYNNLLINLSATDEEIEMAELNLEDAKNNLSLAEINYSLKKSMIDKKSNNDMDKNELHEFYVILNKSKQYNIQSIISMNKLRKLRKNTLISPNDSFFKSELLKTLKETMDYTKQAHKKAKDVYTLSISSSNPEIIKYKSDLENAMILAKNLEENIININKRINEQYKLEKTIKKQIKQKNAAKKEQKKEIKKEEKQQIKQEKNFMDKLTNIFSI